MNVEKLILDELDEIKGMLRKLMSPHPPVVLTENDFTRAKRDALDAREKSHERRRLREAGAARA